MFSNKILEIIFNKTKGHCHFCGDILIFKKYGCKNIQDIKGSWEADHIIQKGKGGSQKAENCLPSCVKCNRLRWHREGSELQELVLLGLIVKDEIKKKSSVGVSMKELKIKREYLNEKRRRK